MEVSEDVGNKPAYLRYTVSAKKKNTQKAGSDAVYHKTLTSGHATCASVPDSSGRGALFSAPGPGGPLAGWRGGGIAAVRGGLRGIREARALWVEEP